MYTPFLAVHSYLRWLVLILAIVAIVRAISGIAGGRPWAPADDAAGKWFKVSLEAQMAIGLIIYFFLSPFTMSAWSNMGETMRNAPLRLIVIEHQVGMIIAIALANIGRARIRKAADPARRHRLAAIFFILAFLAVVLSIPWPFMAGGRPLFRGFEAS
jgi:hypothetical protein